ncbi:hypothetical protein S7711_09077 [Stachybotrys chartarum IBT 7711]|uniref:Zn(2)-C6 fungal-type domain-containing protein n=1 Tax=Stachybotrys chartarum (strain CBS 109288 / IBT 7711) TaxID=1280523 RepID=A0A084AQS8_STACB|nr:hypothetical protein S7711_09077 [Stachybotrys chartarum IBT 7711]
MNPADPADPAARESAPYGHACAGCSKAKCRCISRGPDRGCERCHRLHRECQPSVMAARRATRRASSRTATSSHLEEKLDQLVTLLSSQRGANERDGAIESANSASPNHGSTTRSRAGFPTSPESTNSPAASTSLNFLSQDTGRYAFLPQQPSDKPRLDIFRECHLPCFPFIVFSPGTSPDQIRQERPVLWLGIRYATSILAAERKQLDQKLRAVFAQKIVVEGERSMDLLQGLIVFLAWYDKQTLSAFSKLAQAVASDLRLDKGGRDVLDRNTNATDAYCYPLRQPLPPTVYTKEEQRTALACYCICIPISSFTRNSPMTWTLHLERMLHDLSAHPESLEDEVLVAMVRNCRISDDILTLTLGRYEPETGERQAAPPILHVKALQMRLDNVKATTRSEVLARKGIQVQLAFLEASIGDTGLAESSSSQVSQFARTNCFHQAYEGAKKCFEAFLSFTPRELFGMNLFAAFQFARCTHLIYRYTLIDDPAWDRHLVRDGVDLGSVVQRAATLLSAIPAAMGVEGLEQDVFTATADALRRASPIWKRTIAEAACVQGTAGSGTGGLDDPIVDDAMFISFTDDMSWMDLLSNWNQY